MAYSPFCVVLYLDEKSAQCESGVKSVAMCISVFQMEQFDYSFPYKHERVQICMNAGNISVSLMPYQSYGCWNFNLCGYMTLFYSATFTIKVTPITVTVCYS